MNKHQTAIQGRDCALMFCFALICGSAPAFCLPVLPHASDLLEDQGGLHLASDQERFDADPSRAAGAAPLLKPGHYLIVEHAASELRSSTAALLQTAQRMLSHAPLLIPLYCVAAIVGVVAIFFGLRLLTQTGKQGSSATASDLKQTQAWNASRLFKLEHEAPTESLLDADLNIEVAEYDDDLKPGMKVDHAVHGLGTIIEVDCHNDRAKPYKVQFDNGETHQYSEESAVKLFTIEVPEGSSWLGTEKWKTRIYFDDDLRPGMKVDHPVHGLGTVVLVDFNNVRGKPYKVEFDNGETHEYSEDSAVKLFTVQVAEKRHSSKWKTQVSGDLSGQPNEDATELIRKISSPLRPTSEGSHPKQKPAPQPKAVKQVVKPSVVKSTSGNLFRRPSDMAPQPAKRDRLVAKHT
jgi:hypothetical protein